MSQENRPGRRSESSYGSEEDMKQPGGLLNEPKIQSKEMRSDFGYLFRKKVL